MSLASIVAELTRLEARELDAVIAACTKLKGQQRTEDPHAHLLGVIGHAVGDPLAYTKFKRSKEKREWRSSAAGVVSFVQDAWPGLRRVGHHAVLAFMIDILIKDMKKQDMPVNLTTVCNNLGRAPQVFDAAFPDYRQSGMQHMILKAMGVL